MLRSSRRLSAAKLTSNEVSSLEEENQRLRQLLAQRASAGSTKTGYLFKFRPHATSSLWANPWEVRYVIIRDNTVTYYRTERDVYYPPRGQINLTNTFLVPEGLKRRKYYTFKVVDENGTTLVRLSTEYSSEYHLWMDALESSGCTRREEEHPDDLYNALSPRPSQASPSTSAISDNDSFRGGGGGGATTTTFLNNTMNTTNNGEAYGAQTPSQLRHVPSGYTSDQSDIGQVSQHHQRLATKKSRRQQPSVGNETCAPVHIHPRFSMLSSERIVLTNQRGLLTLTFIILAAANFRLILENMIKYGLRFNPFSFIKSAVTPRGNISLFLCWPLLMLFGVFALGIERFACRCLMAELRDRDSYTQKKPKKKKKKAGKSKGGDFEDEDDFDEEEEEDDDEYEVDSKKKALRTTPSRFGRAANTRTARITEKFVFLLNLINTTGELLIPFAVIHYTNADPVPGFVLTMATTVLWLKLVSYAHVNWSLRRLKRVDPGRRWPGETGSGSEPLAVETDDMVYPLNLSLNNLTFFLVAPTLCYQLSYPRSPRFRIRWVLRRILMFAASLSLMLFILEQYIEPTIENSLKPLQEMDWLRMTERILKLSIPTLYFWLAMFYALFELWLNILAEFTRFGDREFYKDWWNASTLSEYWRLWNMPVHKWMLRHIYFPALRAGVPKFFAGVMVFFVSAVFHEILVGVPLHMLRGWAFWGLMAQVPLMWATELIKRRCNNNEQIGNIIFWVSFCFLGQPVAELLYMHDYNWNKLHSAAAA